MSAADTAPWLAPDDDAARQRALDPSASFITQAPAGSGKTSLLVQRFLVLLSHVDQPEAIVAITFTRKAAAEMRSRIVTALNNAAQGVPAETANDRVTLAAAQATLERNRQRGWDLLSHPARLRIQTIDSLCASIVRCMPWMARTGGMPGIVEDSRELYREAAQQTLGQLRREGSPAGEAAARLLLHLDNNYWIVRTMLEGMLEKRDQWLRHVGFGAGGAELREELELGLAGVVEHGLAQVATRIQPPVLGRIVELHNASGQRVDPPRTALPGVPGETAAQLPHWQQIADFLLTTGGDWRKSPNARQGFGPHYKAEKQEFIDIITALSADEALHRSLVEVRKLPDAQFAESQWRTLESLLALLPVAAAELKVTFRERGVVDFVELGEAARAALGSPGQPADLALSLGGRMEHLLVDEFQDTSISQFELLERLVAGWDEGDGRTLFLVGDPMQSIYRFRQAEVGLFLRARLDGVGTVACEPLHLTSNFRSRPAVVDWVNFAFSRLFPATEDAVLGAVTYSSARPARHTTTASGVNTHAYFNADEQPEAETVARLCEEALAGSGSVAVLVQARTHATAIVAELARRRIRFRAVEFDPLAARPVIGDLHALTRGLLHPGDRASWLAMLRAPWCGLTLAELHALAGADSRAILWERLIASEAPGPRLTRFREALAEPLAQVRRVSLRQTVETAWTRLGGPALATSAAEMADATRYFDLLDEIDQGGETNFGLLERRIGQLFGQPPAVEGPAVELMTIHKAKGLEWDTVILPGLGRPTASDASQLLRWSEAPMPDGSRRLLLAPIGATREEESDPIFAYLTHLERHRTKFETARLLYVAATRARENLHLLGHAEPNSKGEPRPRSGTLLHLLWPVVEESFANMNPAAAMQQAGVPLTPLDQILRRVPADWTPPRGDEPCPIQGPRDTVETEVTFEWAGDARRHAGSVTHRWLERIAREGLARWTPERLSEQAAPIRAALEELGLADDEMRDAALAVETALRRTLSDERGRWLLEAHPEAAVELKVSVVEGGVIHHCSIDRTFIDEDGTRWIVDYKTGTHEGARLDEFLNHERERYRGRMNRYARYFAATELRPIRLGLYYPLLGGWRHWQPD